MVLVLQVADALVFLLAVVVAVAAAAVPVLVAAAAAVEPVRLTVTSSVQRDLTVAAQVVAVKVVKEEEIVTKAGTVGTVAVAPPLSLAVQ